MSSATAEARACSARRGRSLRCATASSKVLATRCSLPTTTTRRATAARSTFTTRRCSAACTAAVAASFTTRSLPVKPRTARGGSVRSTRIIPTCTRWAATKRPRLPAGCRTNTSSTRRTATTAWRVTRSRSTAVPRNTSARWNKSTRRTKPTLTATCAFRTESSTWVATNRSIWSTNRRRPLRRNSTSSTRPTA